MVKSTHKGSASLLIATVFYGLYGVYSRLIGLQFGVFTQNWTRNLIVFVVLASYLIVRKKALKIRKADFGWIVAWTVSGIFSTVGIFVGFNKLPLGTALFVFYAGIIICSYIVGKIFFNEMLNPTKILSIVLAIIGLLFIYTVTISTHTLVYLLLSLISGMSTGIWNTFSKKISDKYNPLELTFYDATLGLLFSFIMALLLHEQLPIFTFSISWLGVLLFALTQIITVQLVVYGFKHLEAQIGTLIMPMEVVFGTLFGYFLYKDALSLPTMIGGILIIFATLLPQVKDSTRIKL